MTALVAGAPSTAAQHWNQIDWSQVRVRVYRLQMRIAKAIRETIVVTDGWVVKYRLLKGLSCMMGNYHVQFLGGEGS